MAGVLAATVTQLVEAYNLFLNYLPAWGQSIVNLLLLVLVVFFYSLFIWKGYKYIAKKNLIELNLNQYNKVAHPFLAKTLAGVFYLIEYILIAPLIIFISFVFFTAFLILLNESAQITSIILVAATIIAVIRMASYLPKKGEELSRDLAKMLPFMILAIAMLNPGFFNFQRIITNFQQIPPLLNQIFLYLAFIIVLEIIMRLFEFVFSLFGIEDVENTKEKVKEEIKAVQEA
jgi:hypothetical protein